MRRPARGRRPGSATWSASSRASPRRPTCWRSTPPSRRPGPARRAGASPWWRREVKELAGQTAKATEEVARQIGEIQSWTGDASEAITVVVGRINEISGLAGGIAAAIEQQGSATQEIVRNVGQAAIGTGEVTSNIAGVARAAEGPGPPPRRFWARPPISRIQAQQLDAEVRRFLDSVRAA